MSRVRLVEKICKENRFKSLHRSYLKQKYGKKGPKSVIGKKAVKEEVLVEDAHVEALIREGKRLKALRSARRPIKEHIAEGLVRKFQRAVSAYDQVDQKLSTHQDAMGREKINASVQTTGILSALYKDKRIQGQDKLDMVNQISQQATEKQRQLNAARTKAAQMQGGDRPLPQFGSAKDKIDPKTGKRITKTITMSREEKATAIHNKILAEGKRLRALSKAIKDTGGPGDLGAHHRVNYALGTAAGAAMGSPMGKTGAAIGAGVGLTAAAVVHAGEILAKYQQNRHSQKLRDYSNKLRKQTGMPIKPHSI